MVAEDPSFQVEIDEDSGETILKGNVELHLDIKVDILKELTEWKQKLVNHKWLTETITMPVNDSYTHKKQSGGSGQFASDYSIEPLEPGSGFEFESKVVGGNVPKFWALKKDLKFT